MNITNKKHTHGYREQTLGYQYLTRTVNMYIVPKHYARVFGVTHQTILEGNGISTLREVSYDVLSRAL